MEELKKAIMDKTGLDPAMAEKVMGVVTGFLKDNPDKVSELLGEHEGVMGKVKGLFGGH
jgi:ABC-type nitrate/sulfonate/bicarbonate transport system substrate-binding protein